MSPTSFAGLWARNVANDIESVPSTFSSWDKCMSKAYCNFHPKECTRPDGRMARYRRHHHRLGHPDRYPGMHHQLSLLWLSML
ncbi:uncharacterized protein N7458_011454 [Penicillium daleae]|uniref:Uncharacterized protein n=1 Tax=Penicillium daleae TaxID=63821 RepID=A0AAD6FW50_9EURO|nr:uncharacterized protein N7458_011454 [Penicillium daleae]KAJ5432298.1 hypothetical protein N7458_011454 [Penicillium daleae]